MPGSHPPNAQYLIRLFRKDRDNPAELIALIRESLWKTGGNIVAAARILDISTQRLRVWLETLKLTHEPGQIRAELARRFRLTG